jgi:hypothetical protein
LPPEAPGRVVGPTALPYVFARLSATEAVSVDDCQNDHTTMRSCAAVVDPNVAVQVVPEPEPVTDCVRVMLASAPEAINSIAASNNELFITSSPAGKIASRQINIGLLSIRLVRHPLFSYVVRIGTAG